MNAMRTVPTRSPFEDPLSHLPRKSAQEFTRGRVIYDAQQPNAHLYVIILGRVKITHTAEDGCQTIGRIARADGLFGEASLIGSPTRMESAIALEHVNVMS
jgi:CRP-like cAMP-binding protein